MVSRVVFDALPDRRASIAPGAVADPMAPLRKVRRSMRQTGSRPDDDNGKEGMRMLGDYPVFPILLSTDLSASRAFYHDTLGLAILAEDKDRIVLRCGGGTQLVISRSTIGTADTQTQMAWFVPDLRAALVDLRAREVRIEEYEAPAPVTVDGIADMGHSWAAWFVDPSRNVLSVVQPKG